jgi:hypothetical protein
MSFAQFLQMEEMKKSVNNIHKNNYTVTPNQRGNQFQVIEKNINKQQPKLERIATTTTTKCIAVDSRDRNRELFPDSNRFRVHINPSDTFEGAGLFTNLKNIESIKLVECIVPDFTGNHSYLTLVIPELQDTMLGTNDKLKKAFAMIFPDTVNGNFVSCKTKGCCYCLKKFKPALANINRLTFEFYAPDGTLVDFGTDTTPPTAPNGNVQVIVILEVHTIESNISVIESHPLF